MSNRIKGVTVEIGGDTTKLQTALKGVNGEINNTQSQLRDVEKLLKLDPGNTELLAQKQRLLSEAVSETKDKLTTLKTAAEQANDALARGDISQEQYDGLQREIVETEHKLKDLETQAERSAVSVQKIAAAGDKLQTLGGTISNAGRAFLPVTAAVTGVGAAAVTTAAGFEASMSQVAATMGMTADEINGGSADYEKLEAAARDMGATTQFSASEAADALNYLALAGYDTDKAVATLPTVLNLAAAGGIDLASASDMVTDAMSALGPMAGTADSFVDKMAKTSQKSNTSVAQLGEAILTVGGTAKNLAGGTTELNTTLGILADNGVKGAEGGTAMRNMILSLSAPTDKAAKCLDDLGVSAFDAEGNMRPMNDIFNDLNNAMEPLTQEEKTQALNNIFNKVDLKSVNAMLDNSGERFNQLSSDIDNADGAAQSMAETMNNNLNGQITALKSALSEAGISIGQALLPIIKDVIAIIQDLTDKFNGLSPEMQTTLIVIAGIVAAVGPVLMIIGNVISAVGTIMTLAPQIAGVITKVQGAFSALGGVLAANPMILIIAAIVAAVAAFIYFWNTSEAFRQFWIDLWENIKAVFTAVWDGICGFFTETIPAAWGSLVAWFQGIPDWWAGLWQQVGDFFGGIWEGMMENPILSALATTIQNLWQNLVTTLQGIWAGLTTIASGAWELLKNIILAPVLLLIDLVTGNFTKLKEDAQAIWTNIQTAASTIWSGIQQVVGSIVQGLVTHVTTLISGFATILSNLWTGIATTASTLWENLKTAAATAVENLKTAAVAAVQNLLSGIGTALSGLGSVVSSGFQSAIDFITALPKKALQWGKDFINGIARGIRAAVDNVTDAVSSVADTIRSFLHFSVPDEGPLTDYESWMPDFVGGLAKGIENSRSMIQKAVGSVSADLVLRPTVEGASYTAMMGTGSSASPAVFNLTQPITINGTTLTRIVSQIQYTQNSAMMRNLGIK